MSSAPDQKSCAWRQEVIGSRPKVMCFETKSQQLQTKQKSCGWRGCQLLQTKSQGHFAVCARRQGLAAPPHWETRSWDVSRSVLVAKASRSPPHWEARSRDTSRSVLVAKASRCVPTGRHAAGTLRGLCSSPRPLRASPLGDTPKGHFGVQSRHEWHAHACPQKKQDPLKGGGKKKKNQVNYSDII